MKRLSQQAKRQHQLWLERIVAERVAALAVLPLTPAQLFDSSKFEIAQTLYLMDRINELRLLPIIGLSKIMPTQVRQGIIDKYETL